MKYPDGSKIKKRRDCLAHHSRLEAVITAKSRWQEVGAADHITATEMGSLEAYINK